MAMNGHTSAD